MIKGYREYDLFLEFIETFSSAGFREIKRNNYLILALEEMMQNNKQFFSVFDMVRMRTEFVSNGSLDMLGIRPEDLTSYHFKEATHPDDLKRHELGLVKLFKIAHELFISKSGEMLISSNFRFRNITGVYSNQLVQCYLFYKAIPYETVYMLNINTDIDWCKKIKHGYHYYLGNDLSFFRYPDEELLMKGNIFTDREFEILRLIHSGLNSEQIGDRLFLSKYTIDTHRRNILGKTGNAHVSDLIYELKEQGLL